MMTDRQKGIAGLLLLLFVALMIRPYVASADSPLGNSDPIQRALELAAQSGTFDYKTVVEQTTYPAPRVSNAGRDPKVDRFGLGGTLDKNVEAVEMTLWQDASFNPETGVDMLLKDGRSYVRRGPSAEWEEINNFSDEVLPDGDPLAWFEAMTNVQQQETQTFGFGNGNDVVLTRYTFDVDGMAMGEYMGELLYERAALEAQMPRGVRAQIPEAYRQLTGTGELWIDADGLPSRMAMALDYGEQENGERITAEYQTDFTNYDRTNLNSVPLLGSPQQWLIVNASAVANGLQLASIWTAVAAGLLAVTMLVIRYHHRRGFYIGYVSLIIFSMVFMPLIDGATAFAFSEYQNERKAEHDERTAEAKREREIHDAVYGGASAQSAVADTSSTVRQTLGKQDLFSSSLNVALQSTNVVTDTDGDDLADADEDLWGTCAYAGAPTNCDSVLDPTDSDADGLTDGYEVYVTTTDPTLYDSDGDGISDKLESTQFTVDGVEYQLDPNNNDTNRDGLPDGDECLVWVFGSPVYDDTASCPDTDGDFVPDAFDIDNDGDGVHDLADINPETVVDDVYGQGNPLELSVDNLAVNQPVILQLDFRPTEAQNLTFSGHVLDWPEDTQGQIQRRLDTTFYTTETAEAQSSDENADNGDVRLIPVLEVTMPYSTGHYSNLPVLSSASADRVEGDLVDEWLDTTELEGYGITIQDIDSTSGNLVSYLPLTGVTDSNSDTVQAYSAIMYYTPSQGTNGIADWGTAHQFRLIWLVQMLTDACIDEDDDPETCEREDSLDIIHVYEDEWQLTGLAVNEEHGLETGVLYEDPSDDRSSSTLPLLTAVAWNLSNTFLTGMDCDISTEDECTADGVRDVELSTIDDAIDTWTGGDNYIISEYQTGIHRDQASVLLSDATETILNDVFVAYPDVDPSMLYVQESTGRMVTLDGYTASADGSLSFDFDGVVDIVSVAMQLATFTYDGEWDVYDSDEYINLLQWQLQQDDDYFTVAGSGTEEDLEGKLLWVRLFYSALYNGVGDIVEVDGDALYYNIENDPIGLDYDVIKTYQATGQTMPFVLIQVGLVLFGSISSGISEILSWASYSALNAGKLRPGQLYRSVAALATKMARVSNTLLAIGIATLGLGIMLVVAGLIAGSELAVRIGEILIQFSNLLFLVQFTIRLLTLMYTAAQAGLSVALGIITAISNMLRISMILSIVFTFLIAAGILVWYLVKYWGRFNSHEAQVALSHLVATIIVMFISLAVVLTIFALLFTAVAVAAVVLAVVLLVLLIAFIIAEMVLLMTGNKTLTQRFTEWLADQLFDTKTIIQNMSSSDRLDLRMTDAWFEYDEIGMTVDNKLYMTFLVTNTISTAYTYTLPTVTYVLSSSNGTDDQVRKSTFAYTLTQFEDDDVHEGLGLGDMKNDWVKLNIFNFQMTRTVTVSSPISLTRVGSGVNKNLSGFLYLNEGYRVPYLGCWSTDKDKDCKVHGTSDTSSINIGESVVFDILPATVTEFALFETSGISTRDTSNWNTNGRLSFPKQIDQDNDGVNNIALGGTDRDDTSADADADFLTDSFEELYLGSSSMDADTDDDGLDDYTEWRYRTDPADPDTDDDGLSDYTELMEGWLTPVTGQDGSVEIIRVFSNPFLADEDEDGLDDLQEYVFSFHPRVATDPSIIENLIQINNMSVDEADGPVLWYQMDEGSDATVFSNYATSLYAATCADDATCPAASADGRFGSALSFDGSDDYLTITDGNALDLAAGDFTIAAWVNRASGGTQVIVSQDDGGDVRWELGLINGNTARFAFDDDVLSQVTAGGTVTGGNWHHMAVTFDSAAGMVNLYVDGVWVDSDSNVASSLDSSAPLLIGKTADAGSADEFDGLIDDVLLYDRVLSADEVAAVKAGRINGNDLYVQPGQALSYSASVSNTTILNNAYGHIVGSTSYVEPDIATPAVAASFEPSEWIVRFNNDTGDSIAPTCLKELTCPITGIDGTTVFDSGFALQFADADAVVEMPVIGQTTEAALAFWLRLDAVPAVGETATVFESQGTDNRLNLTINDNGKLVLSLDGGATELHTSSYNFGNNLGTWVHVAYEITDSQVILLIDGSTNGSSVSHSTGTFDIGPGTLGNNQDGSQPFTGAFDEFFYQSDDLELAEYDYVRLGQYALDYEDSKRPDIYRDVLFQFNEVADLAAGLQYFDTDDTNCWNADSCPYYTTDSISGLAVEFDGVNDQINLSRGVGRENFDLEFSFYLNALPAAGEETYLVYNYNTNTGLYVTVDADGYIIADALDVGTHTSSSTITAGRWVEFKISYEQTTNNAGTEYYYNSEMRIDGGLDSTINWYTGASDPDYTVNFGSGRLGVGLDNGEIIGALAGRIDELTSTSLTLDFEIDSVATTRIYNMVDDASLLSCQSTKLCPSRDDSGAFGTALAIADGAGLTLDESAELQGDYTIAFWAKTSNYAEQDLLNLTKASNEDHVIRFFMLSGVPHFYFYGSDGALQSITGDRIDGGDWRHYALVLDGTTLQLYMDGELQGAPALQPVEPHIGVDVDITLGKNSPTSDLYPFAGSIDEFLYIPAATSAEGIDVLMSSTWPALETAEPFITFATGPQTSTSVAGTVNISSDAVAGVYAVEEEVEAILAFQDESIVIPVVDLYDSELDTFLPFEDVPGSTIFENIGSANDYSCNNDECPVAGLRGRIDRAAYFDGINDGITVQATSRALLREHDSVTYAVWVKGESGTLFDTGQWAYSGLEADMNGMDIMVDDNVAGGGEFIATSLDYTIPQNVWTHIVFTLEDDNDPNELNEDGIAKVYINGVLVDETTYYRDGNSTLATTTTPTIGRTQNFTDFFKGFLDDFRIYNGVILTADEVETLYSESAPVMRFEFDEENDVDSYVDSIGGLVGYPSVTTATVEGVDVAFLNPIPGTDGQIGNLALFDGNGVIEVPDSEDVVELTEDFTVMMWVQTESADMGLLLKGDADDTFEDGEKQLFVNAGGNAYFHANNGGYIRSLGPINDGVWHHVVATWDSDSSTGKIYVDGIDATTDVTYAPGSADNSGDTLWFGKHAATRSNNTFEGKMDELVVYQRALTVQEVGSIYLRELRWYRDHNSANVQIDTDNPTIELMSTSGTFDMGYTQLVVGADDPTSSVRILEIGLKGPSDSAYTWWAAPECLDAMAGATIWCPYLTTIEEGAHEVMFRAVDVVGNETTSGVYTLQVDNTAPSIATGYAGTTVDAVVNAVQDELSWTLTLNGSVSDDVSRSIESASGVDAESVLVTLLDERGEVLGAGPQRATVSAARSAASTDTWSIDYELYGLKPVGEITIIVSAEDEVGNATEQTVGTVILDERAPSVELDIHDMLLTYSTTVALAGVATEQADWYGKVLDLHFEDNLLDSSGELNDASCTTCPAYVDGLFGRAVSFAGTELISAEINNITDTLSLAGWLYYTTSGTSDVITLGDKAQLSTLAGDGIQAQLTTISGTHTVSSTGSLTANAWNHIALTYDGAEMVVYVNGIAVGSESVAAALIDGTTATIGDATQSFAMLLDEVQVYDVALNSNELFALAATDVSGVASVEYWLEQVFIDTPAAENWQTATLDTTGDALTGWSADVSAPGEGFYQLHTRGTDVNGNQSSSTIVWQGQVDTLAPRLTVASEWVGTGVAAQTVYTYTIEDLLIDLDQVRGPCSAENIVYTDTDSTDTATATCTVDGYFTGDTLAACDAAGNCASILFAAADNTDAPHIVLDEDAYLISAGEKFALSGAVSAADGLRYFSLSIDGTEIYSETFDARSTTDTTWSYDWDAPNFGSVVIDVYVEDQNGASETSQIDIVVETLTLAVELSASSASAQTTPLLMLLSAALALLTIVLLNKTRRRRPMK